MFDKTVAELSAALKAKKVSSVELTQGFLDRISKYRDLNAFISLDPGRSLAQAKAADARLAKGQAGPQPFFTSSPPRTPSPYPCPTP